MCLLRRQRYASVETKMHVQSRIPLRKTRRAYSTVCLIRPSCVCSGLGTSSLWVQPLPPPLVPSPSMHTYLQATPIDPLSTAHTRGRVFADASRLGLPCLSVPGLCRLLTVRHTCSRFAAPPRSQTHTHPPHPTACTCRLHSGPQRRRRWGGAEVVWTYSVVGRPLA